MPRLPFYLFLGLAVPAGAAPQREPASARSAVLFVADGLGWGHLQVWLEARRLEGRAPRMEALWRDGVTAAVTVRPADALVPESAGGASMLATGALSRNLSLGLDAGGASAPNVLEKARAAGKQAGLVTSGRLAHAVPAAFLVHAAQREPESELVPAILAGPASVLLGGGREAFEDRLDEARRAGWRLVDDPAQLSAASTQPALGLFAADYLPYAIDRSSQAPTLAAMTSGALRALGAARAGFVLVVDARLIDESSHNNDAAAMLAELDALDEAVGAALDAPQARGALLVLASPHDTGGPAVISRANPLAWGDASGLAAARAQRGSFRGALASLWALERAGGRVDAAAVRAAVRGPIPSLADADEPSLAAVAAAFAQGPKSRPWSHSPACQELARALERTYGVRWLGGTHSDAPVPLFALGPGARRFEGWLTADAAGRALAAALGL